MGELTNTRYVENAAGDEHIRFRYSLPDEEQRRSDTVRLSAAAETLREGDEYRQLAHELHASWQQPGTVTLIRCSWGAARELTVCLRDEASWSSGRARDANTPGDQIDQPPGSGVVLGPRHATVILPKDRDPASSPSAVGDAYRLRPSAPGLWAAASAEHVLHLFESVQPSDLRPRGAIERVRAWACGEIRMSQSRAAGGHAMAAARELSGAARYAAYAAGQAAVVARVAAHELGAAAYAIKAVRTAAPGEEGQTPARSSAVGSVNSSRM